MSTTPTTRSRDLLLRELCDLLTGEGIEIKGARGIEGLDLPPEITNTGFGSAKNKRPDLIGFDPKYRRIVFGLIREDRQSLDSEDSLEEYNVFLDHNAGLREQASMLYVMMPQELVAEFTSITTHYIHREYWHRLIAVGSQR
ncbi:MAG: hypothetical protein AB1428_15275 [Bacteroidota bacterium]